MEEGAFLKAYSIKEVSEELEIPAGTLRQWEKDLGIVIPRYQEGASAGSRYYTDLEIDLLKQIKGYREQKLNMQTIKIILDKQRSTNAENQSNELAVNSPVPNNFPTSMTQLEAVQTIRSLQEVVLSMQETMFGMQKGFQVQMSEMQDFYEKQLANAKTEILKEISDGSDRVAGEVQAVIKNEVASGSENVQKLLFGEEKDEEIKSLNDLFKRQTEKQDKLLMESIRLTQELKKVQAESEKPWWKKILGS